ncbi:MAG: hypothetical protein ABEI52_10145, partial [Halobacteriaceae archaeon]
ERIRARPSMRAPPRTGAGCTGGSRPVVVAGSPETHTSPVDHLTQFQPERPHKKRVYHVVQAVRTVKTLAAAVHAVLHSPFTSPEDGTETTQSTEEYILHE